MIFVIFSIKTRLGMWQLRHGQLPLKNVKLI
jgi:hypothetical protein